MPTDAQLSGNSLAELADLQEMAPEVSQESYSVSPSGEA